MNVHIDQKEQGSLSTMYAPAPLVVGFASSGYLSVLANWLVCLSKVGVKRVKLFALDAKTLACAERWGVDTDLIDWDGTTSDIWPRRVEVFRQLLAEGVEFVHSDLDAIWLRNPFDTRHSICEDADMVFSQGTFWPHDIHRAQGFVLCCGWFLVRPTPAVRTFFDDLSQHVAKTENDQASVNRLLAESGIEWDQQQKPAYQLPFRDRLVDCWTGPILGRCPARNLTVTMLPNREFQRIDEDYHQAYVKHLVSPKTAVAKLEMLERNALLHLRQPGSWFADKSFEELAHTDLWMQCKSLLTG